MFTEQTLAEFPGLRQLLQFLHQGVYPGDSPWDILVFDAVAGFRVVLHYLAGAAAPLDIQLVEDDGAVAGNTKAVFVDEAFDHHGVKESPQEGDEVGVAVVFDGAADDVIRDYAKWSRLRLRCLDCARHDTAVHFRLQLFLPGFATTGFRMVKEILLGSVVVAAAGLTVATADVIRQFVASFVYIEHELVWSSTGRTSISRGYAFVFL